MRDDTRQALIGHIELDAFTLTTTDPAWWERLRTWAEAGWPTGELPTATIDDDHDTPPDQLAVRAARALTANDDDIRLVAKTLRRITARIAQFSPVDAYTPDLLTWCTNCTKDNGHCEPATINGLCGWCSAFRKSEGYLPGVELLHVRHTRGRVTRQLIDRHKPKRTIPARGRIRR